MQSILRSFAAGILTSALVLAGFYYSGNLDGGETNQPPLTMPDVQAFLKTKDMTAVSIKEWKDAKKLEDKNEQAVGNGTEQAKSESVPPEHLYTLDISPGMTSRDISDRLVNAGIIKNTETLDDYLRKHNLSTSIQIGTYSLSSKMSIEEIADIITGNE